MSKIDPTKLRSYTWFNGKEYYNFSRRANLRSMGFSREIFFGKPVIGICNSYSELNNCNAHLRGLADAVKRGVWVLEQVLGQHVPSPPPDVPALDKQDPAAVARLTMRQRTELHRTNPVCANCHQILDPIGFGLEKFDAIGRWRERDSNGQAIDSSGELPGAKRFSGPADLKAIIAARNGDVARNLLERLLAYALGRKLEGYDEIVVDDLMVELASDGYRMRTLIDGVITSYPFTQRRIDEPRRLNEKN